MLFVTALNHFYWFFGATLGGLFGSLIHFSPEGIAMVILATMTTRFLPFLLFPRGKDMPPFVRYLGYVLPSAVFGLLIIYCLKNVSIFNGSHGLPELISILLVIVLHLWKRQMLLSIAGGTVCYVLLIHFIFQ